MNLAGKSSVDFRLNMDIFVGLLPIGHDIENLSLAYKEFLDAVREICQHCSDNEKLIFIDAFKCLVTNYYQWRNVFCDFVHCDQYIWQQHLENPGDIEISFNAFREYINKLDGISKEHGIEILGNHKSDRVDKKHWAILAFFNNPSKPNELLLPFAVIQNLKTYNSKNNKNCEISHRK